MTSGGGDEIPLKVFNSIIFKILKCCIQYVSKFGKFCSGHRTIKSQFSFQFHRRAMSKNVETSAILCSFHMLERLYSKSFKLGSGVCEPRISIGTSCILKRQKNQISNTNITESQRKQRNSTKTSSSASLTMWITTNWKILKETGTPDHFTHLPKNLNAGQEATVTMGHGTTGSKLGKEHNKAEYCHPAYLTYIQNAS